MITCAFIEDMLKLSNEANIYFRNAYNLDRFTNSMPVNIYQENDSIEIRSLIPGVHNEDISVELVDDTIEISGEKKEDYTDNTYMSRERNFGKFRRTVKLPFPVDAQNIQASVENGILTINMHKSEAAKPKKINIQ